MKSILKPASRLIIVFILTMILSGGLLSYLSINSISNFKELTEKKVAEEQIEVSHQVSAKFQEFLEGITGNEKKDVMQGSMIHKPFLVDREGNFLIPWYLDETVLKEGPDPRSAYGRQILRAQQSEFRYQDFERASRFYQSSLTYASSTSDSARSLNALGRVHKKSGHLPEAFRAMSRIASDHASTRDDTGFPYVYYTILNLVEISLQQDTLEILPVVSNFLQGMLQGEVPMNKSTSDLLVRVSDWKDSCTCITETELLELEEQITGIESHLAVVNQFGPGIQTSLKAWNKRDYKPVLGNYLIIQEGTADPGKIALVDTTGIDFYGYCLDIDTLWAAFLAKDKIPYHSEFDYKISLIRNESIKSWKMEELMLLAELSPYFPVSKILTCLADQNLIVSYVNRRSWTYGIALFLLLGAMLLGIILIMRDINRERRLAHLRSDFVSNVSHELKTPLTSIHVFTESVLLDRVKSSADQKEYLKIILKETERLKRMINNILDFSKKEKGKSHYQSRPVDVTAVLKSAVEDLNYWLGEMNFNTLTDIQEGVLTTGDSEALKQVFLNLLENAIKYSNKVKEISIRLTKKGKVIRIEVADKGMGIAEDQVKRIFEKFYRVNNKEVDGIGGTGLGLTVVKEIVDAHKGRISVQSKPGKGSKFIVELNSL